MTLEQMASEERKAYYKRWRAANKEKVKKHNEAYWKKRVMKKQENRKPEGGG